MVKRYYCDYCNRFFIDDLASRKKHLGAIKHRLAKKTHYLKFRDLKTLIEEERGKERCRKSIIGKCTYGNSCSFTHYTEQELNDFERQVKEEKKAEEAKVPSVESWVAEWSSRTGTAVPASSTASSVEPATEHHDLPPSLRPLLFQQVNNLLLTDWG